MTRDEILDVLAANDGCCMDNEEERKILADALIEALSDYTVVKKKAIFEVDENTLRTHLEHCGRRTTDELIKISIVKNCPGIESVHFSD